MDVREIGKWMKLAKILVQWWDFVLSEPNLRILIIALVKRLIVLSDQRTKVNKNENTVPLKKHVCGFFFVCVQVNGHPKN
jgi:hypothetical protein